MWIICQILLCSKDWEFLMWLCYAVANRKTPCLFVHHIASHSQMPQNITLFKKMISLWKKKVGRYKRPIFPTVIKCVLTTAYGVASFKPQTDSGLWTTSWVTEVQRICACMCACTHVYKIVFTVWWIIEYNFLFDSREMDLLWPDEIGHGEWRYKFHVPIRQRFQTAEITRGTWTETYDMLFSCVTGEPGYQSWAISNLCEINESLTPEVILFIIQGSC